MRIGPRGVCVRESAIHGLGVFATGTFRTGDVIEVSPVLPVTESEVEALQSTALQFYSFFWPPAGAALALGCGSLYNHSFRPVARYELRPRRRLIVFSAIAPIARNDEITVNYNGDPEDLTPLWFDAS